MRVVCILLKKNTDAQSIAEIFYRATPQIIIKGNDAIFLEISKCQSLYSEQTFLKRTLVTLKRISVHAKVSIADDIPTALALAVYPVGRKELLPIDALKYYFDPLDHFPDERLSILNAINVLKSLRVLYMNDFLKIPAYQISPRFGGSLLMAYQRAAGDEHPILWPPFQPRQNVAEKHEFDLAYPPRNLEPIYFVLRPLLEKIVLRLRGKGSRARQFKLILHQEYPTEKNLQDYELLVVLQLPFLSIKTIFQIIKEKMESAIQRKPLEHAVVSLSLIVVEEAPYIASQKDIFDQKKEENSESFFKLVSRIATKLGPDSVFFASLKENYLPERNWSRHPEKAVQDIYDSAVPERPLRLIKEPQHVQISNNTLFYNRLHFEILEWQNTEVLLSNWWDLSGGERIYHKLNTHTGDSFWIFKRKNQYYLHGIFE